MLRELSTWLGNYLGIEPLHTYTEGIWLCLWSFWLTRLCKIWLWRKICSNFFSYYVANFYSYQKNYSKSIMIRFYWFKYFNSGTKCKHFVMWNYFYPRSSYMVFISVQTGSGSTVRKKSLMVNLMCSCREKEMKFLVRTLVRFLI